MSTTNYAYIFVAVILVSAAVGIGLDWPNDRRASAVCDKAVKTIFETHDVLELERAGLIVRGLNCWFSKRIPDGY